MTRFWFKLALSLVGTFTVLAIVARASSGLRENPALAGLGVGCEGQQNSLCWYGIVPGVASEKDILATLETYGIKGQKDEWGSYKLDSPYFSDNCKIMLIPYSGGVNRSRNVLQFYECKDLWLGDFYSFIQHPGSMYIATCESNAIYLLYPPSGIYLKIPDAKRNLLALRPDFPVEAFSLAVGRSFVKDIEKPPSEFSREGSFLHLVDWSSRCY